MKACFIGHKKIEKTEALRIALRETVVTLIHKGISIFLFGSKSEFNDLSWGGVLVNLKRNTHILKGYTFGLRIHI